MKIRRGRGGWHTKTQCSRAHRTCHARGVRRRDGCLGALVVPGDGARGFISYYQNLSILISMVSKSYFK